MGFEPPKKKSASLGGAQADAAGAAGGRGFVLPPGYVEAYLKPDKPEQDTKKPRRIEGETLLDELGVIPAIERGTKLDKPEQARIHAALTALDDTGKREVQSSIEQRGWQQKVGQVFSPETASLLSKNVPKEEEQDKDQEENPKKKENIEGGTVFDRLLGNALIKRKIENPDATLAQLSALDERAWQELATAADAREAWQPLSQLIGPRFDDTVARKRYEPLAAVLAAHPDGMCELDERAQVLSSLARCGAWEGTRVRQLIDKRGTARALVNLLGPEFNGWLNGGAATAQPARETDDPQAALRALQSLRGATLRRLVVERRAGATGPALAAALAEDLEVFVNAYWDNVSEVDSERRRTPKKPLAALGRVEVEQLVRLARGGDLKPDQAAEIDAAVSTLQFDVLIKPLLTGAVPQPSTRKRTLDALTDLPLAELIKLLLQVPPGSAPVLELALSPEIGLLVGERCHRPLADTLEAHREQTSELPEAERRSRLAPLVGLPEWMAVHLRAEVERKGSAERLASLFGRALDDIGLSAIATGRPKSERAPFSPPPRERKAALDALKQLTPARFAAVQGEAPAPLLSRWATAASLGPDEALGRALLRFLPGGTQEPARPVEPAVEERELRAFFERLAAAGRSSAGDDPLRRAPDAPPERKKKREGEEEQTSEPLDVATLHEELLTQLAGEAGDRMAARFAELPDAVRRALVDHMRQSGTWEKLAPKLDAEGGDKDAAPVR
jgi:hypothetical protein